MPAEIPARIPTSCQSYSNNVRTHYHFPLSTTIKDIKSTHRILWKKNTGEFEVKSDEKYSHYNSTFKSNRLFIRLKQTFDRQWENLIDSLGKKNKIIENKMEYITDKILEINPEKISLEVTDEGSIYYVFIKNSMKIYLQNFLLEDCGSDEAIVSIFKEEENSINYAGTLNASLETINHAIFRLSNLK